MNVVMNINSVYARDVHLHTLSINNVLSETVMFASLGTSIYKECVSA